MRSIQNPKVPVIVIRHETNSLQNRFRPITDLPTDAVVSIDDDELIHCTDIEVGYEVWEDYQDRMVGYFGRAISCRRPSARIDMNGHKLLYDYHRYLLHLSLVLIFLLTTVLVVQR